METTQEHVNYGRIVLAGLPSWEQVWGTLLGRRSKYVLCYACYGNKILSFSSKVFKTNFIRSITTFREISLHVIPHITACLCQIKGSVSIVICDQYVGSGTYRFIGVFVSSNQCSRLFKGNIIAAFSPPILLIKAYGYLSRKKPANYFHYGSQLGITGYNWKFSALKNKVVIQVSQDEYKEHRFRQVFDIYFLLAQNENILNGEFILHLV